MSEGWKRLDLAGAGLQRANLERAVRQARCARALDLSRRRAPSFAGEARDLRVAAAGPAPPAATTARSPRAAP